MIASALLIAGIAGLTGCGNEKKSASVPALDPTNMDLSVKPGTDFYQFANGGWMKNNPLQAQYSRYGIFDRLGDTSLDQIRTIVNEAASMDQTQGGIPQKITTLYQLGMDSVTLNAQGAEPIREELARIAAIKNDKELAAMIATLHREGIFPYFVTFVDADEKNSTMNIQIGRAHV